MTNPSDPYPPRSGSRTSWIVLGVFVVLTLILSWPVAASLESQMPGTATWAFDESTFAWNIWYFKHALLNLHTSPLHSELIWYPLGIDLILYTYNFFNAVIALPLVLAGSVPLASNVTVLLATVLSGFGAYLLTYYVLRVAYSIRQFPSDSAPATHYAPRTTPLSLAALLAGVIYAFASNRAIYAALGHYDMVTTQWLPFYTLYLLKTLREPKLKHAVLAGLFFALAALAEMIFASFLALFTLIILAGMWRDMRSRAAALGRLALVGAVAGLIWAPALIPIAREFVTADYALTGWGESVKLSADLVGLVSPTDLNPLANGEWQIANRKSQPAANGSWAAALRAVEEGKGRFGDVNTVFLGYATLALAVVGAVVARKRLVAWTIAALIFGVLALGPLLQINGRYRFSLDSLLPEGVTFPLPFALLHFIPFINANRAPNRNSVILMLALAVLAGMGAAWLLERIGESANSKSANQRIANSKSANRQTDESRLPFEGSRSTQYALRNTHHAPRIPYSVLRLMLAVLLAAGIIAEHLAVPLPTTDAAIPKVYRRIAQEPDEFAVMQLPLGWRNSFGTLGSEQTNLQYFQTGHGKPIIGGNISRAPDDKMAYFARIPLFKALTDLEMYREVDPGTDAAARAGAAALMALYDVRYFITTPPIAGRYPYQDTWQRTEAYALDVLPLEKTPAWEADGYKAYRVIQPPLALPFRVDVGAPGAELTLGEGWDVGTDEQPYNATANWATNRTADLYLPLDAPKDVTLRLAIAPLSYDGAPAQTISIAVNGTRVLAERALAAGWQTVEAPIPAAATRRGPNRVRLEFAWAASPRRAFPDAASRAEIGGTSVVSPINLEAHGFSEAYISAFDSAGQETKASTGRRGYNVAVFDAHSGKLLDAAGFDTAANAYEAAALAAYLSAIPRGRIVAAATKGDAPAHLTQAAVDALRDLGSRVVTPADLAGKSHALIGVQGAAPSTAAEAIAPNDAFVRVAGDFRELAAAVDWAEWGP
jgi:hypothetical protein